MKVLKFGGSSVATAQAILNLEQILKTATTSNEKMVVCVSALSKVTDELLTASAEASKGNLNYKTLLDALEKRHLDLVIDLLTLEQRNPVLSWVKVRFNELNDLLKGVYLLGELSARSRDNIVSYGELLSSQIIYNRLNNNGLNCSWLDSRQCIVTDSDFGYARVNFIETNKKITAQVNESATSNLFVAPGFIAANTLGQTTTLGRGGSDYSAAIYAAALDASILEIWTDVSGLMTADPRLVANARVISHISYHEAMELSHFGAKVLFPPTIVPVMQKGIPLLIKNTFAPSDAGTLVEAVAPERHDKISGISSISNVALLNLEGSGMVGVPGFSNRLFASLSEQKINIILITQSSSEQSICVGIAEADAEHALKAVNQAFEMEILRKTLQPATIEKNLAIVALVGDEMRHHTGVSGRMFYALGRNGINIRAIAQGASERNISAVISANDAKKAVITLHESFFEKTYKQAHLYLAGLGNVGKRLLHQLEQQLTYLQQNMNLQIKMVGLANSKKILIDTTGIQLSNWQEALDTQGETANIQTFVASIIQQNLPNSIFIDVSASQEVANSYEPLLQKSISVVACNKIACSSEYQTYKKIKETAQEYNANFLFETNVGAGLPIIGTLNDLLRSGDKILKIKAVLSGTLNFVFNNYNAQTSFQSVVQQAQTEGYTEPDPRLDLSGKDVIRKIIILIREAGYAINMEDVENTSFLPTACMEGDVQNFYAELGKHEAHFAQLYQQAQNKGRKLKYVAEFSPQKTKVGLQEVEPSDDFYHLYGKDNIVLFYTERYPQQPLVIKGAGAGADVTASGIFADILRCFK